MHPLLLASNSPRRKELLGKLQLPFTVQTIEVDETLPTAINPKGAALYLAKVKSKALAHVAHNQIVITTDTIVLSGSTILGKPDSNEDAFDMLKSLSGKTHVVITGVCLRSNDKILSFDTTTRVTFGKLDEAEIDFYIKSGNAMDKAGAYGIQDWIGMVGVKSITGCYYNVMGLPIFDLYKHLKASFCVS